MTLLEAASYFIIATFPYSSDCYECFGANWFATNHVRKGLAFLTIENVVSSQLFCSLKDIAHMPNFTLADSPLPMEFKQLRLRHLIVGVSTESIYQQENKTSTVIHNEIILLEVDPAVLHSMMSPGKPFACRIRRYIHVRADATYLFIVFAHFRLRMASNTHATICCSLSYTSDMVWGEPERAGIGM